MNDLRAFLRNSIAPWGMLAAFALGVWLGYHSGHHQRLTDDQRAAAAIIAAPPSGIIPEP